MESVLVVDDEADILKLVSENLQIRGYQVSEGKTGEEALAQLRRSQPSLMVLDIKLPDFNGWEVLNRMKSDPQIVIGFPVLIVTASITESSVNLEPYPSVVEVIIKPFTIPKLISAVEHALGHKS